ncbi:uncharacterized protein [Physcomitrium patens]|uniref:uncharacterized protein isoform X2 n=1 Tax=Physcomitrium patens TaxID=3218 RepID=UPI00024AC7FA|nr:methyl-CpG-binding domain-containing protein 10-like isoform X2 [Physcomitrium patens]|eukprot:XP_024386060.1 methyl-CpG-binding domain-containing protein 10-like isoform X2 [Physcomitrella patens]
MGSPEADCAAAEVVGTPESAFEELTGPLQGWKRKGSGKKGGTPKRKDVTFVAPDGEEIKTKRQLDKYLKAHPGTLSAGDFEWGVAAGDAVTPPENRRRSARLSSKGRVSGEGIEVVAEIKRPAVKRSRKSRENGKDEKDGAGEEADVKAGTENGAHGAADEKVEENGKDKEETKAMDVDVPGEEVAAVEKTVEATTEGSSEKAEDVKVESGESNGGKSAEVPAEASMKDGEESKAAEEAARNGDAEKSSNGEGGEKVKDAVVGMAEGSTEGVEEVTKAEKVEVGAAAPEAVA